MAKLTETVQSGDWKAGERVPVIHIDEENDGFRMCAVVGEEAEHPNTFGHHITWIKIFSQPEGGKFPVEVASYQAAAHGEGEVFVKPHTHAYVRSTRPGKVLALSYCSTHGLWESAEKIK